MNKLSIEVGFNFFTLSFYT